MTYRQGAYREEEFFFMGSPDLGQHAKHLQILLFCVLYC